MDPVEKVGCCWELLRDVQLDSGNLSRVGRLGSSGHLQVLLFLIGEGLHRAFTKIFSTSALQLCRYPIMKSPSSLNFPQFDGCGMFQGCWRPLHYHYPSTRHHQPGSGLELETKAKRRFAKVSIVSYSHPYDNCATLISCLLTVGQPWGQCPFSIVF